MAGSPRSVDDEARLGKRLVWIVDPIDGTRAYPCAPRGLVRWGVALLKILPALAAAFALATDEFSSQVAGRLRRSTISRSVRCRRRSGFLPHRRSAAGADAEPAARRYHAVSAEGSLRFGCAGSRRATSMPLCGQSSRDWTLRAANLIVQEADGKMSSPGGSD